MSKFHRVKFFLPMASGQCSKGFIFCSILYFRFSDQRCVIYINLTDIKDVLRCTKGPMVLSGPSFLLSLQISQYPETDWVRLRFKGEQRVSSSSQCVIHPPSEDIRSQVSAPSRSVTHPGSQKPHKLASFLLSDLYNNWVVGLASVWWEHRLYIGGEEKISWCL